ncbi:hypothetical protein EWM62_12090 [Mucilaginibacter terrigena]|uniref:Lipoprotein n=1 Tax=Mucilaginibacter terrigena TaxID=2492395 RepID=A0A4Q5LMA8_9SPHI|nr:hypothetical protein [Mucilaginibacter terrigena]RYU90263.1 hypothetical protein EWM62_12090 [Mucilaginibacter terrigena]
MNSFKNIFTQTAVLAFLVISITACDRSAKTDAAKTDSAATVTTAPLKVDSGKLVGAWHDEAIKSDKGEEIAYEVVSSGHKVYIQAITFTGKELILNDTPPISPSASEIRKEGDGYVSVERPDEGYKIDKQGNLLIYDKGILVATCKKIL